MPYCYCNLEWTRPKYKALSRTVCVTDILLKETFPDNLPDLTMHHLMCLFLANVSSRNTPKYLKQPTSSNVVQGHTVPPLQYIISAHPVPNPAVWDCLNWLKPGYLKRFLLTMSIFGLFSLFFITLQNIGSYYWDSIVLW